MRTLTQPKKITPTSVTHSCQLYKSKIKKIIKTIDF